MVTHPWWHPRRPALSRSGLAACLLWSLTTLTLGACGRPAGVVASVQAADAASPAVAAAPLPPPLTTAPPTYGAWRSARIGGGGYLTGITLAPSDPRVAYVHVDVGGCYRSEDGGRSWRALHGNLPALGGTASTRDLNVDPRDADTVLVALGNQWNPPRGIFRSADGGKTWSSVLPTARFYGNEDWRWTGRTLARHPAKPDVILAASAGTGLWRSTDNGQTWTKRDGVDGVCATDVVFDRRNPDAVWLCAQPLPPYNKPKLAGGLFRSDDAGDTWRKVADESPTELLQDPVDPGCWHGVFDGAVLRVTTDGGATWRDNSRGLGTDPAAAKTEFAGSHQFNALAAGPDFIVTANGVGSFFRQDRRPGSGTAAPTDWQPVPRLGVDEGAWWGRDQGPGTWVHFGKALGSITVDPRDPARWWFTDWFALYESRDAGAHWRLSIDGIEVTVIHGFAQDPTDPGVVHMGMADNGAFHSGDGGGSFTHPKQGIPNTKCLAVAPRLPSRVYATSGVGGEWAARRVRISLDRGGSWQESPMSGLPDMGKHNCNSLAADPVDPYRVYVVLSGPVRAGGGGGGVYVSTDGGGRWAWMGEGLPGGEDGFFQSNIWAVGREIAAGTDGSLVALSRPRGTVCRWDAAGKRWETAALPGLAGDAAKGADLRSVVADPLRPGTYFLSTTGAGVFRSADAGRSWQRLTLPAGVAGANGLAVDEAVRGRVAIGTENGVALSEDGGDSWRLLDPAMPDRVHPVVGFAGDRLLAGTGGSGVFWFPLTPGGANAVAARPAVPAPLPAAATGENGPRIVNGAMTDPGRAEVGPPRGWEGLWTAAGKLRVTRDPAEFKAGPASLHVESVDGPAHGSVSQRVAAVGPGGRTLEVSGWVKTAGAGLEECLVAAQLFDLGGRQNGWITLFNARDASEWTRFSGTVQLPDATRAWQLTATLRGDGQVWLDEVEARPAPSIFLDR